MKRKDVIADPTPDTPEVIRACIKECKENLQTAINRFEFTEADILREKIKQLRRALA